MAQVGSESKARNINGGGGRGLIILNNSDFSDKYLVYNIFSLKNGVAGPKKNKKTHSLLQYLLPEGNSLLQKLLVLAFAKK